MSEPVKVVYFDIETIPDYARTHLFEGDVETRVKQEKKAPRHVEIEVVRETLKLLTLSNESEGYETSETEREMGDILTRWDAVGSFNEDEARKRIMATTPEFCQIVGLNYGLNEGPAGSGWVGQIPENMAGPLTETDLLKSFWKLAKSADHLVGYNCLEFDINAILVRSAICGVTPSRDLWRLKPWDDTVIDVMKRRYGMRSRERYLSLKALRRIHQLPISSEYSEILGMTGEQIYELYLNADYTKLELYGKLDIVTTRELARMWGGYYFPVIAARYVDWDYLAASKVEALQ